MPRGDIYFYSNLTEHMKTRFDSLLLTNLLKQTKMAFYIEYSNSNGQMGKSHCTWHIGSQKPQDVNMYKPIFLQADGDELDHITSRFQNIPMCYRICKWRGEMAAFIFENL